MPRSCTSQICPKRNRNNSRSSGIRHVVLLPVVGKKSVIGMLSLGYSRSRRHTREELEFLETAAQALGIAAENLRLLEQVLRSQRQWMNTFDSIQDLISGARRRLPHSQDQSGVCCNAWKRLRRTC